MLISKRHRFIFIHIYKNAGTSITMALKPFVLHKWQWWINWEFKKRKFPLWFDPQPFAAHVKASEIIQTRGQTAFDSFFSFAIIRNPWDWQVSYYNFVLKDPKHYEYESISGFENFGSYIRWRCKNPVLLQKDFIYSGDGKLLVSFVGRYENLDTDFAEICRRIGISCALPKLNVSNTKPYRQYYTDEARELVRTAFAADIDLFGYEF